MGRISTDGTKRTARMSVTERLTPLLKPAGYLKGIKRSIIRRPVLVIPALLVWLLCTVAIVVAVVLSAEKTEEVERDKARLLVTSVGTGFKAALERGLFPLVTIKQHIEDSSPQGQRHSEVQQFFRRTAPTLLNISPAANDLQIAPYGVISAIYPIITSRRNATQIFLLGGHNLFDAKSPVANRREGATATLVRAFTQDKPYIVEGPLSILLSPSVSTDGGCTGCLTDPWARLALIARTCIFAHSLDVEDTWADADWPNVSPDKPRLGPWRNVTDCPRLPFPRNDTTYCDANAMGDGRKFWGISNAVILWTSLLQTSGVTSLGNSLGEPYMWTIYRSPLYWDGSSAYVPLNVSSNVIPIRLNDTNAISTAVRTLDGAEWTIIIARRSWEPSWAAPVATITVFAALVLSVCILLIWVEHSQNTDLLLSVLPARVASGDVFGFSEVHDHVCMLFSDIVSYTTMTESSQPLEIMRLVAALFTQFDSAADRNRVHKVETIGDAYFCCSGAPDPDDPVEQALRITNMALDMVEITRRFKRTHDGQELEIRVGLHCGGPVCAGVVGSKMPHWSLFGDTVNTTSRMESNSQAMRVHISDPMCAQLKKAIESGRASHISLQERGIIYVKGKGPMSTWWVNDSRKNRPLSSTDARVSNHSSVSNEWLSASGMGDGHGPGMDANWNSITSAIQMHHMWTQTREPGGPEISETGSVVVDEEADELFEGINGSRPRLRLGSVDEEEGRRSPTEAELRESRAELIIAHVEA